jgi:hypothetical protein
VAKASFVSVRGVLAESSFHCAVSAKLEIADWRFRHSICASEESREVMMLCSLRLNVSGCGCHQFGLNETWGRRRRLRSGGDSDGGA